jgi:H+-transporting ATPase
MLSWAINKVTKVIQVTGVLLAGFFLLNNILISLLGITLLIFANDFVTMSLAIDNVKYTSNPDKWDVSRITLATFFIGLMLVAEGIIAILVSVYYFNLDLQKLQTFVLLLLVFTSQFQIFILRERRFFWSSIPGKALILSTTLTII